MPSLRKIELERIDIFGGTQTRVATNDEAIITYAEAMEAGAVFPPVVTYYDGTEYWLADGFHRFLAAKHNEYKEIEAKIYEGGRTDALTYALGANSTNGVFRTVDDKRNSVEIALEEWWDRSNSYIADLCKVSTGFVQKVRRSQNREQPDMVTGKDGKQYPAQIEREPRGESEESSSSGGGGGGKPSKKNANLSDVAGGSSKELEAESRQMVRNGEIDPRELSNISSAEATDYAYAAIHLLEQMEPDDKKFVKAIEIMQKWIDKKKFV